MTLHMALETSPGVFEDQDLQALGLIGVKLVVDYTHATQLVFSVIAPEHTEPIATNSFLRVWDEGETLADGETEQDVDHPLFEGFIEKPIPTGPARLEYTAYDPTYRANTNVQVHDLPWTEEDPPTPDPASICRAIYNCFNQQDTDYAATLTVTATVGEIIQSVLDLQTPPLRALNAAPAFDVPYVVEGELDGMAAIPQERIVLTGGVRGALEQILQQYERRGRILFTPGARLWRFVDLTAAPEITLRLNDPSELHPVLQCALRPSIDHCYTALRVDGPRRSHVEEFDWYEEPGERTNTLNTYGASQVIHTYTDAGGTHDVVAFSAWQIDDPDLRRGERILPTDYTAYVSGGPALPGQPSWLFETTFTRPIVLVSYDDGQTYMQIDARADILNGIMSVVGLVPQVTATKKDGSSLLPASTRTVFAPNAVRVVWAVRDPALSVRVPAEGYEGTAYTLFGIERERATFDEALAVGVEFGTAVTTSTRESAFVTLLQTELDAIKDVVWAGQIVLDGIDYRWLGLRARVNIDAADGDGGTVASFPWSAIAAYVTSVEFDYGERMTTLSLNTDHLETMADPEALKQQLKIRALEQREYQTLSATYRDYVAFFGNTVREVSGVVATTHFEYVDPQTGAVQS